MTRGRIAGKIEDLDFIRLKCNKGCGKVRRDIKNDVEFKHTKVLLKKFNVTNPQDLIPIYVCKDCQRGIPKRQRKAKKPKAIKVLMQDPTLNVETNTNLEPISDAQKIKQENMKYLTPQIETEYISRKVRGLSDMEILKEAFEFNVKNSNSPNSELYNVLLIGEAGCYDKDTEVLTKQGWKYWNQVLDNDFFASLSKNGNLKYLKANQIIRKEYKGKMIGWKNRAIDILVTPEHNMLLSNGTLIPANKLNKKNHSIPRTAKQWIAKDLVNQEFAKLMGIFLADGFVSRKNGKPTTIVICAKKERKRQYFKKVIEDNNLKFTLDERRFYICNSKEALKFNHFGKSYDKFVPNKIKHSGKRIISAFLEAFGQGDGHNRGHFNEYYTSSESQ